MRNHAEKRYAEQYCNGIDVWIKSHAITICDASALEDLVTRYVAGRADSGGTFPITVNLTDETIDEWRTVIELSKTQVAAGDTVWFEVYSPNLDDAFYICAETPQEIPMPEFEQNSLMTVEIVLVINEYKGLDTAIEPQGDTGTT